MRTKIIHIFLFFFISYSFSEEFHNYYHHTPTVQFDVPLSPHNTKPDSHIRSPQRDSIPHNSRDRYHFIYFSVTDFKRSFSHIPEKEILERYELFSLPNFCAYAQTLSGYNQFVVALDAKIKQDKHFKKQTAVVPGFDYKFGLWSEKSGFHDFIAAQASEIKKKQSEKKIVLPKGNLRVTDPVVHQLTQEWSARKKYAHDTTRLNQRLDALSKAKATQGTQLDDQLNKELSESRNAMHSLERTFSHDNHVQVLSPLVHSCTQQALKESNAVVAFGLSDFCCMVTDILQHGMNVLYDASYAVTKGACRGVSTFTSIEHWKDMATGALHMSLLCADAMVIQDAQLYYVALSDLIVPESQAMTHLKNSQRMHTQEQIKKALEAIYTTRETLEAMSWQECIENSSKIATTMILDALVFHAMGQCTQTASNAFMRELAKVTETGQLFSKEYAVEVAGFGKLIVEEGPQVANKVFGIKNKLAIDRKTTIFSQELYHAITEEKSLSAAANVLPEAHLNWKAIDFAQGKLEKHFTKHVIKKAEWGKNITITIEEYLNRARILLNSEIKDHVDGFISKEGWVFRYNKLTNEFAVAKPDGTIETLFQPEKGFEYWIEQTTKHK